MTCNSKEKLLEDIELEGFDYTLVHYDDYSDIPDEQFQLLYKQYLSARKGIINHLGLDKCT